MKADLAVLKDRSVLTFFSARSVSLLGNAIAPVAIAFAVLDLPGGTATTLGLVLTARLATQVLFLLFGGVIADRVPRNRVMVGADLAAGLAQGTVAVLFITGTATPAVVAALATVNGAATAMFQPASRGLLPRLVSGPRLQSANALLRLSMNTGSILGASLAGVLVAVVGPGPTLAVDAASFLVSAALLATIRLDRGAAVPSGATVLSQLRDGWREFRSNQWICAMVVQLAFANICIAGGFVVLGPVVAKAHLGGAPAWGLILTAQAIGFVTGSVLAIRLRPRYPVRAAAVLTAGFAPPFFLLAGPAPVVAIAVSMFVTGICIDVYQVLLETAIQKNVPEESLSRVMSYESMGSFLFIPLGLAVAGPIAQAAGMGRTLTGAGVLIVVSAAAVLLLPAVRRVRDETGRGDPEEEPVDRPGDRAPVAVPAAADEPIAGGTQP